MGVPAFARPPQAGFISRCYRQGLNIGFGPPHRLPPASAKPLPGIQLPNPLKEQRAAPRSFWVVPPPLLCFSHSLALSPAIPIPASTQRGRGTSGGRAILRFRHIDTVRDASLARHG